MSWAAGSSGEWVVSISNPSRSPIFSANALRDSSVRLWTMTRSSFFTAAIASSWLSACQPAP
jgi:hypothetical protein